MQVFITNYDPRDIAKELDNRRLNKQILETIQILCANNNIDSIWKIPVYIKNHPTSKLWYGHDEYLLFYLYCLQNEYFHRSAKCHATAYIFYNLCIALEYPWFGNIIEIPVFINDDFIIAMRKKLYEKDADYYDEFNEIKHCNYIENINGMTVSNKRIFELEKRGVVMYEL